MFNLNEYMIDPAKVSVISPVQQVTWKRDEYSTTPLWSFWCVVDGQRVTVSSQQQYEMTSLREKLYYHALENRKMMQ